MDAGETDLLAGEVDALEAELDAERFRCVTGVEPEPSLSPLFDGHSRAAHRQTVAALRDAGNQALADRVAGLRAARVASAEEEAWRAAEQRAVGLGPRGPEPLVALELALPREPDPERRRHLARGAAEALEEPARAREAWAETVARARAEVGLAPDWRAVVEGDEVLSASDDAWKDVSTFALRREAGIPGGGATRADLLRTLSLPRWDGLFRAGMLPVALKLTFEPLGLDLGRVRIDDADRPGKWPGAHAIGARVSFRPRGGAGDWADLVEAAGRALVAGASAPRRRDPVLEGALGWLVGSLLLEPRWLAERADVDGGHAPDAIRDLALRRLFRLRADAAALRVATEVQRGLSGAAWREAHRDALAAATGAVWDGGRASRDADAERLAAAVRGAAAGERLRLEVRERLDEDWWRKPRTAAYLAALVASGLPAGDEPPPAAGAARMLVGELEGGA